MRLRVWSRRLNQSVFKTHLHMSWTSALAVGPARRDRSHDATVKNVVTLQVQRQTSSLQQRLVNIVTRSHCTIFGAELVWRWTKALKNVIYTAFLTGACGSWARHLRVRAPHVVHPEQHLGPLTGLQRVRHRLGKLGGEFVLGEVHADLIGVDQLGQRLQHLGHLRAR